jgi:hypothetical protein
MAEMTIRRFNVFSVAKIQGLKFEPAYAPPPPQQWRAA